MTLKVAEQVCSRFLFLSFLIVSKLFFNILEGERERERKEVCVCVCGGGGV